MKQLLQILFSSLTLGSVYALMSMGLSLIWGGLRVLNLTQGALFMLGAYAALWTGKTLGWPPFAGLLTAFAVTGMIGVAIYFGPMRPLLFREDRENATLLVTVGLAIIFENLALFSFGPRSQAVPELVGGMFRIGGVAVTWNALAMTLAAISLIALVGAALRWTRLGLSIRALAQNRDGAQLAGIDMDRTFALVMFISSGLAGAGGVLLSSYYFVSPYVGETYLLTALIVTILGGLGSLGGTLYAAYLVGLIQAAVSYYLGVRWSLPVFFALIIVTLVVRPSGLAGAGSRQRL
jgi:branched-chain amino acid transport system permease protein